MKETYILVTVNPEYCNYLRKFDHKVSYNFNNKNTRPFIGVLFEMSDFKYFAPLSSPKPKHQKMKNIIDFYKINKGELGAINFNNMIPLIDGEYMKIEISDNILGKKEWRYKKLLQEQLRWLNRNGKHLRSQGKEFIYKKSQWKVNKENFRKML